MLPPPAIVDEAHLERPEFDLAVGLGFWAPTDRPVAGAVLAFVSWSGLDVTGSVRFYEYGQLTVWAGVEGFYSRSIFLEAIGELALGALDPEGDWNFIPVHYGAAGRLGVSFLPESRFQPGVFFVAGSDKMNLGMEYTSADGVSAEATYGETAMRLGGGVGGDLLMGGGWLLGFEYRYQSARTFVTTSTVTLADPEGNPLVDWEQQTWQSPPRGSAWAVRFGRRF